MLMMIEEVVVFMSDGDGGDGDGENEKTQNPPEATPRIIVMTATTDEPRHVRLIE